MPAYTLGTPHHALTGVKPCLVTVDMGAYVTVVRPDIAARWPERQLSQRFKLQAVSGETLSLTLTLGRRPLKIRAFVTNITNELILGLDILRAYNASVDLGCQTLHLAGKSNIAMEPSCGALSLQRGSGQGSSDACKV
jgi:hypothetical protein